MPGPRPRWGHWYQTIHWGDAEVMLLATTAWERDEAGRLLCTTKCACPLPARDHHHRALTAPMPAVLGTI